MKIGPSQSKSPAAPTGGRLCPSVGTAGNGAINAGSTPTDSARYYPEVVNPHNEVAYVQVKTSCGEACRETKPQEEKSNNPGSAGHIKRGDAEHRIKALRKEERPKGARTALACSTSRPAIIHFHTSKYTRTALVSGGAL